MNLPKTPNNSKNLNEISILINKINQKLRQIEQKREKKILKYPKTNFQNKTQLIKYHKSHNQKLLNQIKTNYIK